MASVPVRPISLKGPWGEGYVLDYHTISGKSTSDPYFRFDTKRTELGELLFQLKYHRNPDALAAIVDTAENFIRHRWSPVPAFDCIVPAPPSADTRKVQPVFQIVRELATRFAVVSFEDAISKVKTTPHMWNIDDWHERQRTLHEAIQKGSGICEGKRILLFDDLTESGATLWRVAEVLNGAGAAAVYALVLTRPR